jgi:hypothetical protein
MDLSSSSSKNSWSHPNKPSHLPNIKCTTRILNYYQKLGLIFPYNFSQEGFLYERKGIRSTFFIPCIQLICLVYELYLWIGLYILGNSYLKNKEYFELCYQTTWGCCWGIGLAVQFHIRVSRHTLANYFNQTLVINEELSRVLGNKREFDKKWGIIDKLFIIQDAYTQIIPIFSGLIFIPLRDKKWFWFRHLPELLRNSVGVIGLLACYEYAIIGVHMGLVGFEIFVWTSYIMTVYVGLQHLSKDMKKKGTGNKLKYYIRHYNKLRILNGLFNECFGSSLIPAWKLAFGLSFIFCCSGLIKLSELGDPILLVFFGKLKKKKKYGRYDFAMSVCLSV